MKYLIFTLMFVSSLSHGAPLFAKPFTVEVQDSSNLFTVIAHMSLHQYHWLVSGFMEVREMNENTRWAFKKIYWLTPRTETFHTEKLVASKTKNIQTYCWEVDLFYHGDALVVADRHKAAECFNLQNAPEPQVLISYYELELQPRYSYESWGYNNCSFNFFGELGDAYMFCSPEPFIGF